MNARVYAQALSTLSAQEGARADVLVKQLVESLKKNGRLKLLPHILRALRTTALQQKSLSPLVEVAHKEDAAHALTSARIHGIDAKEASINPSLIRGWRARARGTLVDASGKRALVELYRNITG